MNNFFPDNEIVSTEKELCVRDNENEWLEIIRASSRSSRAQPIIRRTRKTLLSIFFAVRKLLVKFYFSLSNLSGYMTMRRMRAANLAREMREETGVRTESAVRERLWNVQG